MAPGARLPCLPPTKAGHIRATTRNAAPLERESDFRRQPSLDPEGLGLCVAPKRAQGMMRE